MSVSRVKFLPVPNEIETLEVQLKKWAQGKTGPQYKDRAHCRYMLYNPHIKEDGTVYPCCGKTDDRVIGNIYRENILEIYKRHHRRYIGHQAAPFKSCSDCVFFSHYNQDKTHE